MIAVNALAAAAQVPMVTVRVCRFGGQTPEVTNKAADAILARCSDVMKQAGCPIVFLRDGDVTSFDNETGIIENAMDYTFYNNTYSGFNVRIFNSIQSCVNQHSGTDIAGCSDKPSARKDMAINVQAYAHLNHLLWIHEYGHNKNLSDIVFDDSKIMNLKLTATNTGLRGGECALFTVVPGQNHHCIVPAEQEEEKVNVDDEPPGNLPAAERAQEPRKVDVREFVHSIFVHGFPYDQAVRYGREDAYILRSMLSDPKEKPYLPNIVTTLCLTGDPEAAQPLLEFFQKGEGKLSTQEFNAKRDVLIHLGVLINMTKNERSLDFLLNQVSDAGTWDQRVAWLAPFNAQRDKQAFQDRYLASAAIKGLGISGMPRAISELHKIRQNAATEDISRTVDQAIHLHEQIQNAENIKVFFMTKSNDI